MVRGELAVVGNEPEDGGPGLRLCHIDGETGDLGPVLETAATDRRSMYGAHHPNESLFYAVDAADSGTVAAFRLDVEEETLTELNRQPTEGESPCYCSVGATGDYLFVTNFGGGSVTLVPIEGDGRLGPPVDVVSPTPPGRPDPNPEPHAAVPGPDDRYLYVPDRGNDVVAVFRVDRSNGRLRRGEPDPVSVHEDSGPRHLRFTPGGDYAYLITEHDGSMVAFERAADTGELTELTTVSTLPSGYSGENHAADVRVHPSGDRVYGSNRGHDSIVVFERDGDGTIEPVSHVPAGGAWPWGLSLAQSGERMYAANYEGDCITSFVVRADGGLERDGDSFHLPNPLFVLTL